MSAPGQPEESRSSGRFWPVVWMLAFAFVVWLADGLFLLKRDLWMDEVHSWLLLTAPTQNYMLKALADGADFNPPGWYLVSRWVTAAPIFRTETAFRLLSLVWMSLSGLAVWILLARHYSGRAAALAVAAVAAHPLIIYQSTEIRFYSFWCMTTLWLVVSLDWKPRSQPARILRIITCCLLSVLTVTTHYFGIISVGLVCIPESIRLMRRRQGIGSLLISLLPGIISLVTVLPFLKGQRAALTRPTWISPPTISDSLFFLEALLPYRPVLIGGLILLTLHYVRKRTTQTDPSEAQPVVRIPQELICLSVMPVAIVLISWLLQPAMVTRYAIAGILPAACFFVPALNNLSGAKQRLIGILLLIAIGNSLRQTVKSAELEAQQRIELANRLREHRAGPIVMEDRIVWMSLLHRFSDLQQACWLVDFADDELIADSALRLVQRDAGRRIAKWFPVYHMLKLSALSQVQEFYVVTYEAASVDMLKYPQTYSTTRISADVYGFKSVEKKQHLSLLAPKRKRFVQKSFDEGKR